MDVIIRSNNNPVNDMIALMSELINNLDKAIKNKSSLNHKFYTDTGSLEILERHQ